jgi:hypothetical protein
MKSLRLLAGVLFAATPAAAQMIRGEVVEPNTGSAVASGFVVLIGPDDKELARAQADDRGRFTIRAPAAGTYRLRSERIGFRVTVSRPFDVAADATVEFRLEVNAIPIRLQEIRVAGETRCRVRPEEGRATATVWEEARKALAAVAWGQNQQVLGVTIRNFERTLSPALVVQDESSRMMSGRSSRPYRARPGAELAAGGYIQKAPDGALDFFGPDAEVLFSDPFLNTHCFKLEAGAGETAPFLGLAFEPMDRPQAADAQERHCSLTTAL